MEKYNIIKFINKGSYGKVYLVEDKVTKEKFALKRIRVLNLDRYAIKSIHNEVNILANNSCDYLLKLKDIFTYENTYICIVTNFFKNGDLTKYCRRDHKLTDDEIYKIFSQLCIGLFYLHKNNIIHRDIKPGNILVDEFMNICICDFGVSKKMTNKITNTFIGTPLFMSPEQISNRYYDIKIDIWSLACVLYEMTFNKHPFDGRSIRSLKEKIMHMRLDSICRGKFGELFSKLFVRDKYKRPSINEILELEIMKQKIETNAIKTNIDKMKNFTKFTYPITITDWKKFCKEIKDVLNLQKKENEIKEVVPGQSVAQAKPILQNDTKVSDLISSKLPKITQPQPVIVKYSDKCTPFNYDMNNFKNFVNRKQEIKPVVKNEYKPVNYKPKTPIKKLPILKNSPKILRKNTPRRFEVAKKQEIPRKPEILKRELNKLPPIKKAIPKLKNNGQLIGDRNFYCNNNMAWINNLRRY
jgi:serine/threonine protein kinase